MVTRTRPRAASSHARYIQSDFLPVQRGLARRTAVSLAVAAALPSAMALSPAVFAQDAAEDTVQEVVITGRYQKSIIDSIETKRNATSIVEAVSAEDIGKLPDSSIAEAVSRLPGLAGQRLDGRASSISIRGFGEDFSAATFNGREQVSIGDSRNIQFDLYPSEIMAGVTVYKTPDATLMAQGIGGTVDLATVRPLDSKRTLHVGFNLEKNDLAALNPDADNQGWRGSVAYIDKFAEDRVGVALSIAALDSPSQEQRWNSWGYPTDAGNNLVLGGAKPYVRSSQLKRNTAMGVLEFAATDKLRITADALYIDFTDDKTLRGIEIPGAVWGGASTSGTAADGFVQNGSLDGRRVQVRNDFEKRDATMKSYGLNFKYDINESWGAALDASRGEVSRDIWSLESYSGTGRASCNPNNVAAGPADTIGFTMQGQNLGAVFAPSFDYADDALINLGGAQCWGNGVTVGNDAQDGFINFPHIEDELTTVRLSFSGKLDSSVVSKIDFGLYYADRQKSKLDQGVFLTIPNYPGVNTVPAQYRLADTSLAFIGMGNMLSYDAFGLWQSGFYTEVSENLTVPQRSLNTWTVNEKLTTLYVKADLDTEVGARRLTGNVGVQVVQTDQSSDGLANDTLTNPSGLVSVQAVRGGAKYTDVLPSLNLIYHLNDEQQLRASASRVMSRSRMDRMNASRGITFDVAKNGFSDPGNSPWGGGGGNPELRPQTADQFDLNYAYYFRKDGFVSIGGFYKKLKDWQIQAGTLADFSGLTPPGGIVLLPGTTTQGLIASWVNSESGSVRGIEAQATVPLSAFSPKLEGFGVVASASFLKSGLTIQGFDIPVPGLSDRIYNLTAYFEKHGFGARVSLNKRSDFFGLVYGTSFVEQPVVVEGSETIDAQLSYNFSESNYDRLKGLSISLQAQNLSDEPFITYNYNGPGPISNVDKRQVRDYQVYGRNYLLGFSYKF